MNCRLFCCRLQTRAWLQIPGMSRIPERRSRSHLPWVPFKKCSYTKEDRLGGAGWASLCPGFLHDPVSGQARRTDEVRHDASLVATSRQHLKGSISCHRGRHLPFQTKPWSWSGFAGAWSVRQPVWRQGHAVVSQRIRRAASLYCQDWERDHRRGITVGEHPKDAFKQQF